MSKHTLANYILVAISQGLNARGVPVEFNHSSGAAVIGGTKQGNCISFTENGHEVTIAVVEKEEPGEDAFVRTHELSVHCADMDLERLTDNADLDNLLQLADEVSRD